MTRLENWPRLLSSYLQARKAMPFEWGENDCMTFVAYAVEAITGVLPFAELEGYATEAEANQIVQNHGGIEQMLTGYFGEPNSEVRKAKRGDVVMIGDPFNAAGIVDDTGVNVLFVSTSGLVKLPLRKAAKFWGV